MTQVGSSTHSEAKSTPTSIALTFCALGLFMLAFLSKALVRIPMENSGMGIFVEEDCAMDNVLLLPGGIVDGQQDVVHTNMYSTSALSLFFLMIQCSVSVDACPPAALPHPPSLPMWCMMASGHGLWHSSFHHPAPPPFPSNAVCKCPLPMPAAPHLPTALPHPPFPSLLTWCMKAHS